MPDRKIRRVLVTTDTVGGVWTFSIDLARQFAHDGIQVVLAALGGLPTREQVADAESIPELCLLSSGFKLEWMDNPWSDVEDSGKWLLRLEEEYRPDLVHLNSFAHGALPWKAPVVLTAHSCVLSWWKAVKDEQAPPSWDRYRACVTRSLRGASLVTCPTAAMADALADHYQISRIEIKVVPNGSDATAFRTALHREEKQPLVLTAGRLWDEAKNIGALANCAQELPWPVFAAGKTEHPNGSGPRIHGVHSLGHLPPSELAAWYARAVIFALPARYEPFGLSILEAALSSCALVLGDLPSLREIWGDAALFVAPADFQALRSAILSLIADDAFREDMSRRAYGRALAFPSARTANLYLNAYDQAYDAVHSRKSVSCVS